MIGEIVGGYRVVAPLADADRGGMGAVYLAEHVRNGRKAVLKQLRIEAADAKRQTELAERFFREARAAATIDDPDIVQVFDNGQHTDGSYYIIMEKLSGESLAQRLAREGRQPPATAAALTRLVARVLGVVHKHNVIHRDLKPANIFLVPDPHVGVRTKVLDFGIAKIKDAASGLTATEGGFGTAPYMSPEQFERAAQADVQADIYALGCIFFEMLCGRPPFEGPSLFEFMHQHCRVPPPAPSSVDPALSMFDPILARCLAKDPNQRFGAMDELSEAIGKLGLPGAQSSGEWRKQVAPPPRGTGGTGHMSTLSSASGQSAAVPPKQGRWKLYLLAGTVVGAGAVAAFVLSRSDTPMAPPDAGARAALPLLAADAAPAPPPPAANRWVRLDPPAKPVFLGLPADAGKNAVGFRADRRIAAPTRAYELQEHEVTWGEIFTWTDKKPRPELHLPADRDTWKNLPANAIPWPTAREYCAELDARAHLPTEEQWEYAARGEELRPYSWGDAPLDLLATHAWQDKAQALEPVKTSHQDVTPNGIYDLMGNAREWTADIFRADRKGDDESWVGTGDKAYRAVRGLPLVRPKPSEPPPAYGAAWRGSLCNWDCAKNAEQARMLVGFRCAREVE